jgi:serine/threonine protein kinase
LLGLQELHSLGYAHLDIKPDNMVIQHGAGILKLIDFGESLPLRTIGDIADRKGAPYYRDSRGGSAPHRDLYSLGVVLGDLIRQFGINDPFLLMFPPALKRHFTVAGALTEFSPHFTDQKFDQARTLWSRILSMEDRE